MIDIAERRKSNQILLQLSAGRKFPGSFAGKGSQMVWWSYRVQDKEVKIGGGGGQDD